MSSRTQMVLVCCAIVLVILAGWTVYRVDQVSKDVEVATQGLTELQGIVIPLTKAVSDKFLAAVDTVNAAKLGAQLQDAASGIIDSTALTAQDWLKLAREKADQVRKRLDSAKKSGS